MYLFGQRWANGNPDLSRRVGYMVEVPYAYPNFTVRENLNLMARLRGLPVPRAVDEIMEQLKLTQYADSKARDLSLGNAQKLGLAKALIHKPDVLILDEPSNALDPAGIVEIREMLKALASQQGVTVFISSHILEEMSKMVTSWTFGREYSDRTLKDLLGLPISRGYLVPIGFAFTTLMLALVFGPTAIGKYLPWSVPALHLQESGVASFPLADASYFLVFLIGLAGVNRYGEMVAKQRATMINAD
ncbi:ATP-binding cassette domain-containing protein [Paenibacillus sp. cl141a]|uniref:ATP-binding cassette domain-containing protein n=1 Tax=Paenibacillus sp. cl141a TaxID=1761877 RepID=UPI0034A2832C